MARFEFLLEKLPGHDDEKDASLAVAIISENPEALAELNSLMRKSIYAREVAPLMLRGLVSFLLTTDSLSEEAIPFLLSLSQLGRPSELHSFGLDEWISLWNKSCSCSKPGSTCRLSECRSVLAVLISDVIDRAEKGPLWKNRENFLLSFGGQLLSKYFIPESERPVHALNTRWIQSIFTLCQGLENLTGSSTSEPQIIANHEVMLRLLCAVLACGDSASFRPVYEYIIEHGPLLSMVNTKVLTISVPPKVPGSSTSRSADFELIDTDMALTVWASQLYPDVSPKLIPLIWSQTRREDVLIKSALCLLRSNLFVKKGIQLSRSLLTSQSSGQNSLIADVIESLLTLATSHGDESFMSLEDRQSIFTDISSYIANLEVSLAVEICESITRNSSVDSVVGLSIKMLKDTWAQHSGSIEVFHRTVKILASSDYQVMDGMDSLKSLLNWARLVYLIPENKSPNLDAIFGDFLGEISRKIDIELNMLNQDEFADMKRTRLVLVGHLVARVKELLRSH